MFKVSEAWKQVPYMSKWDILETYILAYGHQQSAHDILKGGQTGAKSIPVSIYSFRKVEPITFAEAVVETGSKTASSSDIFYSLFLMQLPLNKHMSTKQEVLARMAFITRLWVHQKSMIIGHFLLKHSHQLPRLLWRKKTVLKASTSWWRRDKSVHWAGCVSVTWENHNEGRQQS